jgi:hypothetical protein
MSATDTSSRRLNRPAQWMSRLAIFVSGLLLFETLTGLSIYLLPFSVSNQIMVLLHTLGGLLFAGGYACYQFRHWKLYRRYTLTHIKLTGYIAWVVTALCGLTGFMLTWQAGFGRQISPLADRIHILTTFAIIAFLGPHIVLIILRDRRARTNQAVAPVVQATHRYLAGLTTLTVILFLFVLLGGAAYTPVAYSNTFPSDYSMPFGKDKPFAPSLASTSTGGAFDARSLSDSRSCGQSGCHEDIYREWSVSAHRWAAMDPPFQAIQTVMAKQNGPESTRYCGGCHDPVSLFSGTKNIFAANLTSLPGYNEGISCIVCHSIKKTDIKGNAAYVLSQPERYILEGTPGRWARWTSDFLIRAYPRKHRQEFNHRLFKSPEFCAACHKQFIDKEVNKVGWVQLQNQYDNWRKSHWNQPGNPRKTIECRECHMPLLKTARDTLARDPGDYNRSVYDGQHRSHRFIGANQFVPGLLKLPGWEEQTELTHRWLRGEMPIPEIADKWRTGPAVPIKILAPAQVTPGSEVLLTISMGSNKVGHDFPTGPLDIIQAWLEIKATDDAGRLLYASGRLDARHFVEKGSFLFRAEPVDQYGNLIERHNLWEMVGVRYKRSLFPGYWDETQFSFRCPANFTDGPALPQRLPVTLRLPAGVVGQIHVQARLRYRKIGQFLVHFTLGEKPGLTAPVTDLSTAEATVQVAGPKVASAL